MLTKIITSHNSGVLIDCRIMTELPAILVYELWFSKDILKINLTGDVMSTSFHAQKQTNPDFITTVSTLIQGTTKDFYQDVKS